MVYLEEKHGDADIAAFISRLPEEAKERYAEALRRYEENRGVLNRLRNETVFHYPKGKSVKAISRAIEQAQEDEGTAGSEKSNRIRDARMFFADDLLARMVFNAAGGSEEAYARLVEELAQAVRDFMKFTNAALDQLFIERVRVNPSG